MLPRERFLKAVACEPLDRPPVWVMRQAGRYLPEYRKMKEQYSFLQMVQEPELAVEVSMQPLRRYPLDAAIVFSDILVIPEAMGQPYHFRDTGGIGMDFTIDSPAAVNRLEPQGITEKLAYVGEAIKQLREELGNQHALLGFGGSPWTLAAYMLEGGGSANWGRAKSFCWDEPVAFGNLMEQLCQALADYFRMQIESGVDAIQIFDSWGAACSGLDYQSQSLKWIRQLIQELPPEFPVILYAKGMADHAEAMEETGAKVLSLDWTVNLPQKRKKLSPKTAVQGNLDPTLLDTNPDLVQAKTLELLQAMEGLPGHIFNLGHGIHPTAKPENMATLVETVVTYKTS